MKEIRMDWESYLQDQRTAHEKGYEKALNDLSNILADYTSIRQVFEYYAANENIIEGLRGIEAQLLLKKYINEKKNND